MEWFDLAQDSELVEDCCEEGTELLRSKKCLEIFDRPSNWQLL
jgi:hypothetical protein